MRDAHVTEIVLCVFSSRMISGREKRSFVGVACLTRRLSRITSSATKLDVVSRNKIDVPKVNTRQEKTRWRKLKEEGMWKKGKGTSE